MTDEQMCAEVARELGWEVAVEREDAPPTVCLGRYGPVLDDSAQPPTNPGADASGGDSSGGVAALLPRLIPFGRVWPEWYGHPSWTCAEPRGHLGYCWPASAVRRRGSAPTTPDRGAP